MGKSGFVTPGCPGRGRTAGLPGVGKDGRVLGIDGLVVGAVGLIEGIEGFVVGSVGLVLGIEGLVDGIDGFIPAPGLGVAGLMDGNCGVEGVGKLGRVVGLVGFGRGVGMGLAGADGIGRGLGAGRDMFPPEGLALAPCGILPPVLRDIPLNPSAKACGCESPTVTNTVASANQQKTRRNIIIS